jgi:HPt (histidine-containing phosphotransfer) domain-containing protein
MADPIAIAEAMNRMWTKFLPEIEERVVVLETAAAAASRGALTGELRLEALSAAHKLAGVLGTFGLDEGTVLARESEAIYEREPAASMPNERAAALAAQLRAVLAGRPR